MRDDVPIVSAETAAVDPGTALLGLYDGALAEVYGYVVARCGDRVVAEDVTAEVFMAAVTSINRGAVDTVTVAWLVGIARHKLVDHWRRIERDQRRLQAVVDHVATAEGVPDPTEAWDAEVDAAAAHRVLAGLGAHHRIVLTLRYVDGLSVADVASIIDRTLHATEALLVRARRAFRHAYEEVGT